MRNPRDVIRLLRTVRAPLDRVHIIEGWFDDTFPTAGVGRVALLHIDTDWYESVKLGLEHFYDGLEPGAMVVLDAYHDGLGCKAPADDFVSSRGLRISVQEGRDTPPHFRKCG